MDLNVRNAIIAGLTGAVCGLIVVLAFHALKGICG